MNYYVLIEKLSGVVKDSGKSPPPYKDLNLTDNFVWFTESLVDPKTVYFADNDLHVIPEKPSPWATWDVLNHYWMDAQNPAELELQLQEFRAGYKQTLDLLLSKIRATVYPTGQLQEVTYRLKLEQALKFEEDKESPHPLIEAEAALKNKSIQEVVDSILLASKQTEELLLELETLRMNWTLKLPQAKTREEATAIYEEALDVLNSYFSAESISNT